MSTDRPADPRPFYAAATAWVGGLLEAVTDDQLALPTPCDEFDVAALSGHLIGTARRAVALGEGADALAIDVSGNPHDPAEYTRLVAHARELWSDDTKLTETVHVPWGEVPGAGALWGYVNETFTHGWDLATATGQHSEADPAMVEPTLAVAAQFIPAEIRGDDNVPFGPVVESAADAGPTERLANWNGRPSR